MRVSLNLNLVARTTKGGQHIFKHFVEGQGLGGYLNGTIPIPIDERDKPTCSQNNSKEVTWIQNSIL